MSSSVFRLAARERSRTARETRLTSDYCILHPTPERPLPPAAAHFFLRPWIRSTVLSSGKTDVGKCQGRPGAELWDWAARGGEPRLLREPLLDTIGHTRGNSV